MATAFERATSSDVAKRFGFFYDEAMTHPVEVERNGAVRVVMLSASEYHRLAKLDHVALGVEELDDDDVRSIRDARASAAAAALDHLMDDAAAS